MLALLLHRCLFSSAWLWCWLYYYTGVCSRQHDCDVGLITTQVSVLVSMVVMLPLLLHRCLFSSVWWWCWLYYYMSVLIRVMVLLVLSAVLQVAVRVLETGVWGAYYNVMTNLKDIKDENFKSEVSTLSHCTCTSACLPVSVSSSLLLSDSLLLSVSLSLSCSLSVFLSVSACLSLAFCLLLSVCLSVHLFLCVCLCVSLSVCPPPHGETLWLLFWVIVKAREQETPKWD